MEAASKADLDRIAELLIQRVTEKDGGVVEGAVRTIGRPRYRRLDRGGRALAYVKTRLRKRCVRVELSWYWTFPRKSRLFADGVTQSVLLLRSEMEVDEAAGFLLAAVSPAP